MKHQEFLEELCKIVSAFSKKVSGDEGPCFCGRSWIARLEIEHDIWQGSTPLLHALKKKLEVE